MTLTDEIMELSNNNMRKCDKDVEK